MFGKRSYPLLLGLALLPGLRTAVPLLQPPGGGNIGADEDVGVVDGCVVLCPPPRTGLSAANLAAGIVTHPAEPDRKRATKHAAPQMQHERLDGQVAITPAYGRQSGWLRRRSWA